MIAGFTTLMAGCDFLDATEVSNPRTTPEELANAPEPTAALLPGMRAQFGRALNAVVVATAVGSDDYSSHRTGLGGNEMDFPRGIIPNTSLIASDETASLGIYWHLQELRSLGDFIIDEISPTDDTATPEQLSEARYYRGMAYLMQGENFVALPTQADEVPVLAGVLLQRAAADFAESANLDGTGEFGMRSTAALARTHRALGNVAEAGQFAQAALDAAGADFLYYREYDNTTPDADTGQPALCLPGVALVAGDATSAPPGLSGSQVYHGRIPHRHRKSRRDVPHPGRSSHGRRRLRYGPGLYGASLRPGQHPSDGPGRRYGPAPE